MGVQKERIVSQFIPQNVLDNPYYESQPFYKFLSDTVLRIYEQNAQNKSEYPFSLFTQKYVSIVLETKTKLIGLNNNPKLGWSFPVKNPVRRYNLEELYFIDGQFAVYIRPDADCLVFLFTKENRQKHISSSEILKLKSEGKFRKCTDIEKIELLYFI